MITFVFAVQLLLLAAMLLAAWRGPAVYSHALVIGLATVVATIGLGGSLFLWSDVSTFATTAMVVLGSAAASVVLVQSADLFLNGPLLDDSRR